MDQTSWADGNFVFPMAARLLAIPQYRTTLLQGFVLSVGSKTDSTVRSLQVFSYLTLRESKQRTAGKAVAEFALKLPAMDGKLSISILVNDVVDLYKRNFSSNHIAVPALQMLLVLAEAGVLKRLNESPRGHDA
jgi:hypothetical protein